MTTSRKNGYGLSYRPASARGIAVAIRCFGHFLREFVGELNTFDCLAVVEEG